MPFFDYQESGARWLAARKRALLADEPRVGKTPTAILACDLIAAESILVTCPAIARPNWQRAFDRWSIVGRPVRVVESESDPIEPRGVTILSMDGSRSEALHARIMAHHWDVLIADECHFFKEPTAQRTRQVLSAKGFASVCDRIWFLTGTATPNHPGELYVILRTIGVWTGTFSQFLDRFCVWFYDEDGRIRVIGAKNVAELKALMAPVVLRRTRKELNMETPSKHRDIPLNLSTAWKDELDKFTFLDGDAKFGGVLRDLFAKLDAKTGIDLENLPKTRMTTLRRASGGAKMKPASAYVRSLIEKDVDKIVIFAVHKIVCEIIQDDLRPFGAKILYGGTDPKRRQDHIDNFHNKVTRRVLVCNIAAAGTAIDLSCAAHVVFVESSWTPGDNEQAFLRLCGPNQKRDITVDWCFMAGTTDELVQKANRRKIEMIEQLWN